jgi:hypothetical protein
MSSDASVVIVPDHITRALETSVSTRFAWKLLYSCTPPTGKPKPTPAPLDVPPPPLTPPNPKPTLLPDPTTVQ